MTKRMETLRSQREAIIAIAARHKAINFAIFGSVARGEDTAISDVDILVDFLPGASLIEHFCLQEALSEFLKTPVDVISRKGLKPRDTRIRQEALTL